MIVAVETRTVPGAIRAVPRGEGKMPTFEGRAIAYNSMSLPLQDKRIGPFREIIRAGAVRKTMLGNAEVVADVNHEQNQIIGRRSKGTLKLTDGADGLDVVIDPPATSYARDAAEAVGHGDYPGMSFQFTINEGGERFHRQADGLLIRELTDINLERVSVVGEPAYPATEVNLRSAEAAQRATAPVDPSLNLAAACAAQLV